MNKRQFKKSCKKFMPLPNTLWGSNGDKWVKLKTLRKGNTLSVTAEKRHFRYYKINLPIIQNITKEFEEWIPSEWKSAENNSTNQRFHIDLGIAKIIKGTTLELEKLR